MHRFSPGDYVLIRDIHGMGHSPDWGIVVSIVERTPDEPMPENEIADKYIVELPSRQRFPFPATRLSMMGNECE